MGSVTDGEPSEKTSCTVLSGATAISSLRCGLAQTVRVPIREPAAGAGKKHSPHGEVTDPYPRVFDEAFRQARAASPIDSLMAGCGQITSERSSCVAP